LVIAHLDQYQPVVRQRFQQQQGPSEFVVQRRNRHDRSVLRIPRVPRANLTNLPFFGGTALSEEGAVQAAAQSACGRPLARPECAAVQLIKVATLRGLPVSGSQCEEFRQACIETAGCYKSPESAEAELVALEEKLLLEARPTITLVAEPHDEQRTGPAKAPVPIWTRTATARSANAPQRGGSKCAL